MLLNFPYICDATGTPLCERVYIMNLSLGYVDETYGLEALAAEFGKTPAEMAAYCWDYVQARDCFLKPWLKVDCSACPRIAEGTCHCQFGAELHVD